MCTSVRPMKCPVCGQNGKGHTPYTETKIRTVRCGDSYVPTPAGSKFPTKCYTTYFEEDTTVATDPCASCKKQAIETPKTEAELAQEKKRRRDDEREERTKREDERQKKTPQQKADAKKAARERLNLGKIKWKATDPAKTTTPFVPMKKAPEKVKATIEKTPKKTRGAVEKAPKKNKKFADRTAEVMLTSASNHHQK